MKKIIFILLALISGTAFSQSSAEGSATVNAEIVSPISISETGTDLNFGSIVAAEGGNVRVNTEGTRTFANPNMEVVSPDPITAASFDVTAASEYSYSITIPSIVLTGAGDDMPVSFTHDLEGETGGTATGSGEVQTLKVGGLLTVASGQTADIYEGTVTVTVSYE